MKTRLSIKIKTLIPLLLVILVSASLFIEITSSEIGLAQESVDDGNQITYLPMVFDKVVNSVCSSSRLGSILFQEPTSGESTAPYLENLTLEGYTGLVGSPTYEIAAEHFPNLVGWDRGFICNMHACLRDKAEHAFNDGLEYEYLAYDPERLAGVPDEEKYNLPWATQVARQIADEQGKRLIISYSTKQLHQEAEERGYYWDDPSQVVAMLAPYGDAWLIQAADEYWVLDDYTVRPILSQRVYPPGPEFRAQVQRWVNWIRAANPDIEIWIQLGMQRIGVIGQNEPSADMLLEYRNSIADLVDGIYITTIYGSIEQLPIANQEMVEVFHRACITQGGNSVAPITNLSLSINLIEEGWTNELPPLCSPTGECLAILPGYYYRIYENSQYPCGAEGYHQFMVLDNQINTTNPKDLFIKFPGGAVGFWYYDETNQRVYYPNDRAIGLLTEDYFRNIFFRTGLTAEYAGGVTRKFRENPNFRIMIPSYCSHDFYLGEGEYNEVDGFSRWGYLAAMSGVDFVQQQFTTLQLVTYGGSAGAAGAFYIGKDQDNVTAIIIDSQAIDLSAISSACEEGFNVFGNSYPCYCPEGGQTCMEVLAPRIDFTFLADEPYIHVQNGLNTPIYFVWNERDASLYAYMQYENMHNAILQFNPGDSSVANMVCITDPRTPPGPICNLHVPSAFDFQESAPLVQDIYIWALSQLYGGTPSKVFLPVVIH